MSREEWGVKRICQDPGCGARFYDLKRNPINCPICGKEFIVDNPGERPRADREAPKKEKDTKKDASESHSDEDDLLEDVEDSVELDDDMLDESDDDTVPLDDIANVASDDES